MKRLAYLLARLADAALAPRGLTFESSWPPDPARDSTPRREPASPAAPAGEAGHQP